MTPFRITRLREQLGRWPRHSEVQCYGKRPFWTRHAASIEAARLGAQLDPIVPYLCPQCQCWHVGKTRKLAYAQ